MPLDVGEFGDRDANYDCFSEFEKYERSEELGDPIHLKLDQFYETFKPPEFDMSHSFTEEGSKDDSEIEVIPVVENQEIQVVDMKKRAKSENNILSDPIVAEA